MPRVVDHEERRALVAAAFRAHLVEHGLAATTFARVAAAAGISVGLVQHYFASREELLRFVYTDALRRRDDRIAVDIAEDEAEQRPIRQILARAVRELLPLDATRTEEFHLTVNLLSQALHDPAAAAVAERADRDLHLRASVAVNNGKECGEVGRAVDAAAAASLILGTSYGLAARLSLSTPTDRARHDAQVDAVLGRTLGTIFTGRCHHYDRP